MAQIVDLSKLTQFAAVKINSDQGYIGGPEVIPNTARIYLKWVLGDSKQALNVLHGGYTGGFHGSPTEADAILTGLTTGAQWTALAAHIAPTVRLQQVWIQDVNAKEKPIISSLGAGGIGASSGTELPDEVALVVTLRTGGIGRQNRGRMYIPGWATTALATGNVAAAAAVTALGNWASIISGVLTSQGYQWGIGHRERAEYTSDKTGTTYDHRDAGLVPIQTVVVRDNHWDSQRRRGLR